MNLNDPSGLAPPPGSGIVELNLRSEALGPSQFEKDLAEFQAKTDYIARKSEERRANGRTFEELLNHFNYLQTTEGAERERFLKTGEAYMPGFRAMSDAEQNAHMALTIPMLAASEIARKEKYLQEDIADREFFHEYIPFVGHTALEGIGLIPGAGIPADLLNGVWYAAEGDFVNAGFSFGAAIPAAGYAFNVAKAGSTSSRLYRASKTVDIAHNFVQSGHESYQGYRDGNVIQIGLGAFGFGLNTRAAKSLAPSEGFVARSDGAWTGPAGDTNHKVWSSADGDIVVDGLPGRTGVVVPRRLTPTEIDTLSYAHGREFSLIYEYGPGRNGGGGTYRLFSGKAASVPVPADGSRFAWIYHTHPGVGKVRGTRFASDDDIEVLKRLIREGSPQRSSIIVPRDGTPFRFNTESRNLEQQ